MDLNNIKQIAVKFPNFIPQEIIEADGRRTVLKLPQIQDFNNRFFGDEFAGKSNVQVGGRYLPRIEGFNCTWMNQLKSPTHTTAQFTFAGSEENKVMALIEKYNGVIVPIDTGIKQWITSDNPEDAMSSNPTAQFERVHERINP